MLDNPNKNAGNNKTFTNIENLRYRDNNEYTVAKFREKGFDFTVREDIIDKAANLKSKRKSFKYNL